MEQSVPWKRHLEEQAPLSPLNLLINKVNLILDGLKCEGLWSWIYFNLYAIDSSLIDRTGYSKRALPLNISLFDLTDSTLEDILAQAREQPASLTSEVLDEDEDSSSEGEHQEPPTSRPPEAPKEDLVELPVVEDDSCSEDDNEEGFTFVKETSSEKVSLEAVCPRFTHDIQ